MVLAVHVVLFPLPVPGHYLPISSFAHSLASCSSDVDVRVTLILTDAVIQKWQQQQRPQRSDGDDNVHIVAVPDGLPLDFDRSENYQTFFRTIQQMGPTLQKCLMELQDACPISCFISDPYFPWMEDVANSFSLPLFLFITDSAAVVSVLLHTRRLLNDGLIGHGSADKAEVVVDDIPGVPALPARSLPFPLPQVDVFFNLRVGMVNLFQNAAGLLINTFRELEEEAVDFASHYLSKPVLAVGPCVPDFMVSAADGGRARAGGAEEEELIQWLDAQMHASVMYVSFGSLVILPDVEIQELWKGLKASKQPFLWATRSKLAKTLVAEAGMAEVQEQGRVVEWAPQQRVLSHPAIGGFMTHCGWNAALEGVTAGVPMLCCPLFLDQPLTSALIVREWRMGLQLAAKPLESAAVERHVRLILVEEEGKSLRQRASELRQTAIAALCRSPAGSSAQSLNSLIKLVQLNQNST